ncbi:hypothetical protein [Janthinobacterium sp. ROICE36]|uniref:hypothetical protein n=1 Tax=Janthinobacterium sp. ROICE36 TaxID=2048670 RepID=UPI0027E432A7|nr:hypothetical protein [Janthinobacterium sp. ROICE36]
MELHILIDGTRDLGGQLYRQLSEAIRSGRLSDGQQLPPSRLLASQWACRARRCPTCMRSSLMKNC